MIRIARYVRFFALFAVLLGVMVLSAALWYPPLLTSEPLSSQSDSFWSREGESLVNINTATLDELCTLPQIGPARAQAILQYREEHGGFDSVEELCEVKGISDGILSVVREYITT